MIVRPPNTVNLKLLRVFESVARHGSFSRAAAELSRSQATVSLQIRELEAQMGLRLLDRTTRRVTLTEPGITLADALAVGFQTIGEGVAAAREHADGRQGRLLIACVPSLSSVRLPSMLASYRTRDKTTRIEVEELTSSEIVAAMMQDAIEFGIGPCAEPCPPEIAFTSVIEEPLCALVRTSLAPRGETTITLEVLATMPLVMLSGSVLLQLQLEEAASSRGMRFRAQTEVRHVQTAIGMAAAGVGVAIVPKLAMPEHLGPELTLLPIVDPTLVRRVGIIARRGRPLRPVALRLARFVGAALAGAITQPVTEIDSGNDDESS